MYLGWRLSAFTIALGLFVFHTQDSNFGLPQDQVSIPTRCADCRAASDPQPPHRTRMSNTPIFIAEMSGRPYRWDEGDQAGGPSFGGSSSSPHPENHVRPGSLLIGNRAGDVSAGGTNSGGGVPSSDGSNKGGEDNTGAHGGTGDNPGSNNDPWTPGDLPPITNDDPVPNDPPGASNPPAATDVPEPASASILLLGVICAIRLGRRLGKVRTPT